MGVSASPYYLTSLLATPWKSLVSWRVDLVCCCATALFWRSESVAWTCVLIYYLLPKIFESMNINYLFFIYILPCISWNKQNVLLNLFDFCYMNQVLDLPPVANNVTLAVKLNRHVWEFWNIFQISFQFFVVICTCERFLFKGSWRTWNVICLIILRN